MILTRTPYRISFLGGGTDYPAYYREHPGAVLVTSIDKYLWLTVRKLAPFFGHSCRMVWREIEECSKAEDIKHPVVREVLDFFGLEGLEIHYQGDLPAQSGMGSSSAFTVGLLRALGAFGCFSGVSNYGIAEAAIDLEQNWLHENVGSQDQMACAVGGFNRIDFQGDFITPRTLPDTDWLAPYLMLMWTGFQRTASEIAGEQIARTQQNTDSLKAMYELVGEGEKSLAAGDWREFGRLVHYSWGIKRTLSDRVSTPEIDSLYERAMQAGAVGGKLLGAGGGGFLLLVAEPERQAGVEKALGLMRVPFRFEHEGTQVVYSDVA